MFSGPDAKDSIILNPGKKVTQYQSILVSYRNNFEQRLQNQLLIKKVYLQVLHVLGKFQMKTVSLGLQRSEIKPVFTTISFL